MLCGAAGAPCGAGTVAGDAGGFPWGCTAPAVLVATALSCGAGDGGATGEGGCVGAADGFGTAVGGTGVAAGLPGVGVAAGGCGFAVGAGVAVGAASAAVGRPPSVASIVAPSAADRIQARICEGLGAVRTVFSDKADDS